MRARLSWPLVIHPLDPLTAAEIGQAAAVRRDRGVTDGWRFASVELREPAKADLPDLESGRLARREALVVSFHATVANYEYLVYWRFYQDGNIECEVRATGVMVTSHVAAPGSRPANGTLVDTGIYAPFHQHFIVARLDLDVDGAANTVYVTESEPASPSPGDPYALGLTVTSTPLRTELDGRQDYHWATSPPQRRSLR